ncbi:MAG: internal scaffolding protein [Microviridae sp.]|nr:MAG: internal scaffolding protein [Microviridae sp.]
MKMKLKQAYDDFDAESVRTGLLCEDVSMAKQSFKEECDVNTIVRRFGLTGQLPENVRMPTYQDFEGPFDFQGAMNAIVAARESFQAVPADVRYRFHNDPEEFVAFCSDRANLEEARKMGLVPPEELKVEPKPLKVEVVTPVAPVEPVKAP